MPFCFNFKNTLISKIIIKIKSLFNCGTSVQLKLKTTHNFMAFRIIFYCCVEFNLIGFEITIEIAVA